jgi:hypothetical protein
VGIASDDPILAGSRAVVGDSFSSWADCDVINTLLSFGMEHVGVEWCRTTGGYRHPALNNKLNLRKVGRPVQVPSPGGASGLSLDGAPAGTAPGVSSWKTTETHVRHRTSCCRLPL